MSGQQLIKGNDWGTGNEKNSIKSGQTNAWDQSTALGPGSSSNSLASKMFSSSPGLICMWEAKRQVLGLVGSKQNANTCAGLEEGGSHTDSGAGWAGASNGLIVLSQSCLQKLVGQVVPSDYPNNLKEEEKRKKDTSQYHRCATKRRAW